MSFSHPRRTTKTTSAPLTPSSSNASGRHTANTNMCLHKGATFHSPTTPERELPHHFKVPSLPRRSQSTLEDVVDAHKRRVALTLGDIDRGLSSVEQRSPTTTRQSFPDEADPVPQGFLNHTVGATDSYGPIMDPVVTREPSLTGRRSMRLRHNRRPSRYADSGLGSSIGSASGKHEASTAPTSVTDNHGSKSVVTASAITRSAAAHSSTIESLPRLSELASNRIHEHILKPLLAKKSLKDFHPIVEDCPRRIHGKEIVCLRDLEKTLMFMAPVSESQDDVVGAVAHWISRLKERTKTAALYLDFCLTSIRCIQATVELLSDREQTRPHDRPYTNGYFVDLVDQINQHAQHVRASKEKTAKGEKLDEMDPESYVSPVDEEPRVSSTPASGGAGDSCRIFKFRPVLTKFNFRTDEVKLHGGFAENGRRAELVRIKNGKAFSMATGKLVDLEEDNKTALQMKRSLSEEAENDESILRSMARRKRSASASELAPKRCREPGCDKQFKRPCDLTKHEKTHSRPWKCPVESCKYHEYGWPTEKEMDRHHNDKHSVAPPLYECHFKPCPYRSKRESNCKQHMEKAHGWEYVRSKNNGKTTRESNVAPSNGLPTPQTTNVRTPSSEANTVNTPEDDDFDMHTGYDGSALFEQQNQLNFPEYNRASDMDMFTSHQLQLDYSPVSDMNHSTSSHQSPFANTMGQDHFQGDFQDFDTNVDFNLYDNEDLYSANVRLPTPSHEIFQSALNTNNFSTSGNPFTTNLLPHLSPIGQGDTMLCTPDMDEGFDDFIPSNCNISGATDFQLFPSSTGGTVASSAPSALFGEIPPAVNFPALTPQELLDFYANATQAAINNANTIDWATEDQITSYERHEIRR